MAARPVVPQTAAARTGGSRFLCAAFVAVVLAGVPVAAPATVSDDDLARVGALIKGGATQLALRLIDQLQPPASAPDDWITWEKQRYALYRTQGEWAQLVTRVAALPPDLSPEFVRWARTEAARAELGAGRAAPARAMLRGLLWGGEGSAEELAEWRQLVIRSYLIDGNIADALTALDRYRLDFNANTRGWRQLEATILLRAGRFKEAYLLAGDIKTHDGQLISLLSGLRAGTLPPATVVARAQRLAEETRNRPALSVQAWSLTAEAAARASDPVRRMYALERALTLARQHAGPEQLVGVRADELWDAYQGYAEGIGNEARLLIGNDGPWLKKAESWKRDEAMQARAFYALLATQAAGAETRALATARLTDSLIEDGRGEVLRALYTGSRRYPDLVAVPNYVRYRLADLALAGYDIALAAQVMQGLETPPDGHDQDLWVMRRARVLIYGGKYPDAVELLAGLLASHERASDAFADRYLQVLFDLQAAGRHRDAIKLFEQLMAKAESARVKREIYYWIADSQAALGEHQKAAELYLRSASYNHPTGGDMWGQTARFHAGEALGKAGMTRDARLVLEALLRHTTDPKQRAQLERSIQQLWLIESRSTTP
jgi:hypothetical protein